MAYIDYTKQKDDLQENVFTTTAALIIEVIHSSFNKNIYALHGQLQEIYDLVYMRMKEQEATDLLRALKNINDRLYRQDEVLTEQDKTAIYDELLVIRRSLYKTMDGMGILFKVRTDLDSLVTRGNIG